MDADIEDGVVDNNVDGTAAVADKSMDGDGVVDSRDDLIVLLVPTCGSTGVVWSFATKLLCGAAKPGGDKPGGNAGRF